jgi:hypothetical protein
VSNATEYDGGGMSKTIPLSRGHVATADGEGRWEAVPDDPHPDDEQGGRFWRVRWSEPMGDKGYLYVRHYGGNGSAWNQMAAEGDAKRMNEQGRHPSRNAP